MNLNPKHHHRINNMKVACKEDKYTVEKSSAIPTA